MISNFGQFVSNPIGYISPENQHTTVNDCFHLENSELKLTYPVLVRESAPITTPPSNSTAIMDVYVMNIQRQC